MPDESCELCSGSGPLRDSHIIPECVYKPGPHRGTQVAFVAFSLPRCRAVPAAVGQGGQRVDGTNGTFLWRADLIRAKSTIIPNRFLRAQLFS